MQQKMPLVSIITPSLNQSAYIEDTIRCIKDQDYSNIEHIIVDGGSTDNTLDIIRKYERTYNLKWTSEPDSGMYAAINKGMRGAKGEILAYLNTDDLYLPWTVSVVVNYLSRYPEIHLVYGDLININIATKRSALWFYPEFSLSFLLRRGTLGQPSVFFRRSVVEKVGLFDESLKLVGDCEYWIRAAERCKVSKIAEFLAVARDHPDTLRERSQQRVLEELELVRERHGALERSYSISTRILDRLRSFFTCSERCMRLKFLFYYWLITKGVLTGDSRRYPWQRLIEYPGFRMIFWNTLLMVITPLSRLRLKIKYFVLDLERDL
jgi:glycosyltransferase involved in cell wall biosynthesis